MEEDTLQHHNFVAVTHNSSLEILICYFYRSSSVGPGVVTSAEAMRIIYEIQLESRNPLLRLTAISTSENKDTSPTSIAVGEKKVN